MDLYRSVSFSQQVIFGPGSLRELSAAADALSRRRIVLCAGPSQRSAGRVQAVNDLLDDRLVGGFDRVTPHVQQDQVNEVTALAREYKADALLGLGGGSALGVAKAAALALHEDTDLRPLVFAIPTTYAGSEMTAVAGITRRNETPPRKVTVSDERMAPRLVIYDPLLTLDLPPNVTASTGMNALAHCVEALYSTTRNPVSSLAAAAGAREIAASLSRCWQNGADLPARTQMLRGAHLAGLSLAGVKMGLHHGLCHVLGGSAGVPHGVANAILLPHVLRFNAPTVAPLLTPLADALKIDWQTHGAERAVYAVANQVTRLVQEMNLPTRLRDTGVNEADLPMLAELAFRNPTVQNNPRPVESPEQIEVIFHAAW